MILKIHKDQGKLGLQVSGANLNLLHDKSEGDYFVYRASNDLPIADLFTLVDNGVLFEDYPFKVRMKASEVDNASPLDGYETIGDIPTPREYSNDESEVLIGAIMKTQGDSGRYLNQNELEAFRGAGYELLGKADIQALKESIEIWKEEDPLS
jgi:hypothetical protein